MKTWQDCQKLTAYLPKVEAGFWSKVRTIKQKLLAVLPAIVRPEKGIAPLVLKELVRALPANDSLKFDDDHQALRRTLG